MLLLLCLYVSVDLANPMIAGAFHFDPDESVEAVRADRSSPVPLAPVNTTAPTFGDDLDRNPVLRLAPRGATPVGRSFRQGFAPPWPHSGPIADLTSPTDDH